MFGLVCKGISFESSNNGIGVLLLEFNRSHMDVDMIAE